MTTHGAPQAEQFWMPEFTHEQRDDGTILTREIDELPGLERGKQTEKDALYHCVLCGHNGGTLTRWFQSGEGVFVA